MKDAVPIALVDDVENLCTMDVENYAHRRLVGG
jgi:hypothetical protein